jgi:hypothetical protein
VPDTLTDADVGLEAPSELSDADVGLAPSAAGGPEQIKFSPYDIAKAQPGYQPMGAFGPINPQEVTQLGQAALSIPGRILEPIAKAGGDILTETLREYGLGPEVLQTSGAPIPGVTEIPGTHISPLRLIAPEFSKGVEAETGRLAREFTAPEQLATLPLLEAKPIQALFAGSMAANLPDSLKRIAEAKTSEELGGALTGAGADIAMAYMAGRGLVKSTPRGTIGERTPDARSIEEAAKVHGDLRTQPGQGPREVPVQEGGAGVQPQAQGGLDQASQVLLTQAQENNRSLGLGHEVEVLPDFGAADPQHIAVFKAEPAQVNALGEYVAPGKIRMSAQAFNLKYAGMPAELRESALRSELAEEGVHATVTPAEAGNYVKTLTAPEIEAGKKLYLGARTEADLAKAGIKMTPQQWGHELLRQRMQRLLNLEPTEIAELAGKEKWSARSIEAIARVIRRLREFLGTEAAQAGRVITKDLLQRYQENLNEAARGAEAKLPFPEVEAERFKREGKELGGELPFSIRRDMSPEEVADEVGGWKFDKEIKPYKIGSVEVAGVYQFTGTEEGRKTTIHIPSDATPQEIAQRLLAKTAEFGLPIREHVAEAVKAGIDPKDVYVTVSPEQVDPESGKAVPGSSYVQVDVRQPDKPHFSTNPNEMRRAGFSMPTKDDFLRLGKSQLALPEANARLAQQGRYMPAGERQAASIRRKRGMGEEEPKFSLPPVAPGQAMERPGAAELGAQVMTPNALEAETIRHLNETVSPDFGTFAEEMKRTFGDVKPGQLRDTWISSVWKRLMTASGADLKNLVKGLGLQKEAAIIKGKAGEGPIADPLPQEPSFRLAGEGTRTAKELDEEGRARIRREQNRRNSVIATIGNKLISQTEPGRKGWSRKEISSEDMADPRVETKQPVYNVITTEDQADPANLGRVLTDDARAFGGAKIEKEMGGQKVEIKQKGLPISVTKRVTAIQNLKTGKVSVVSTFRDGRRGAVLLDPQSPEGTHSPLDSILKRFRVLSSVLLDEPVKNFRQDFQNLPDYENGLGAPLRDAANKFSAYEPPPGVEGAPEPPGAAEGPMTPEDASNIIDYITGEVGDPKSVEDIKLAFEGLSEAPQMRGVVAALKKAGRGILSKEPNLPEATFLDRLANQIYENHRKAKTLEEFQRVTMEEAGATPGKALGLEAGTSPAEAALSETSRELTMRKRIPPTVDPNVVIPKGPGPGPELASLRRVREESRRIKDEVSADWARIKNGLRAWGARREVKGSLPRLLDGADNASAKFALGAGNHIRVASGEDLVGRGGIVERFRERLAARQKAGLVRRAAKVLIWSAGKTLKEKAAEEAQGDMFGGGSFTPNYGRLKDFREKLDVAEMRANQMMMDRNPLKRAWAKKWLAAVEHAREEVNYAAEHWHDPELMRTAVAAREELKATLDFENDNGSTIQEREIYTPGRYEGDFWGDSGILFPANRLLGTGYRLPKRFQNYYEALSVGPYIPRSWDIADLVEHRVMQGHRIIERRMWEENLKNKRDPATQEPIAKDAEQYPVKLEDPLTGEERIEWRWKSPDPAYVLVHPRGGKPLAVREGYRLLVDTLLSKSVVEQMPLGREAIQASAMLKHGVVLILDTFHPGRIANYGAALLGRQLGWRGGHTALAYRPADMDAAVRQGLITQAAADWAREPIKVNDTVGGRTVVRTRTRADILQEMVQEGLNAAKITDALYKDAVQNIPFVGATWHRLVGPYNGKLFNEFIPGMLSETAVRNFEKYNQANPNVPYRRILRDVIRDTNVFYGNMGRQGIFKSATFRDIAQIFVLAPLWQEGLINKEARFYARLGGAALRGVGADIPYRRGLPSMGTLGSGMARGLLGYFILTQLANLATRGHLTFQNKEEGHKLDAWIPSGKGEGFWLSPMAVFAEVTHDFIRLNETKPKTYEALIQFGENRLGPIGRFEQVIRTGESPMGEKYATTGGYLRGAFGQLAPTPIAFGTPGRALASKLFPHQVSPPPRGALQRQLIASLAGVKVQTAETETRQMYRHAEKWIEEHGLKKSTGWQEVMTDESSYAKLRTALRNNDLPAIQKNFDDLRKTHTPAQMLKAMRIWSRKGFTGSKKTEGAFRGSLNDAGLEAYTAAMMEKKALLNAFEDWYVKDRREEPAALPAPLDPLPPPIP